MKTIFKYIVAKVLEWEARILLMRLKPEIIAVSGSVGKTSTKDAIYTALTPFTTLRKSEKSFNSELGLPLTILGLPNAWNNPFKWIWLMVKGFFYAFLLKDYPKHLVLEVGSDKPGDIGKIATWLKVKVAVLTRFPEIPVHVEFFEDGHAVNEEDKKILKALTADGVIVSNADEEELKDVPSRYTQKIISYGVSQDASVRAQDIKITYRIETKDDKSMKFPTGMQCSVIVNGKELPLSVAGSLGNQHIYPLLAALAVVQALNFDIDKTIPVLIGHESPKGRMKIIPGIHHSTIIDDTYNSSPVAVEEALKTLAHVDTSGKKIAILGDMLELGMYTEREHMRLGTKTMSILDTLITVGLRAEDFANGAIEVGMHKSKTHMFADAVTALNYIKKNLKTNDILLIKGSQGMRLEKIIPFLMESPDKAKDLLVRQEKEWEAR
jgi:UDP-N-acetylmuramyl pentapeptide synthase